MGRLKKPLKTIELTTKPDPLKVSQFIGGKVIVPSGEDGWQKWVYGGHVRPG